ncbi:MAG: M20/M25/M40 family metallo-hydrolase, partial [Deltaproteobacteria bacterium]|nr:M20/M25/M40 family metallo-hydrolase [Deltaproteobacteria bacterium]
ARAGARGGRRKVLCLAHLDTVFGPGEAQASPFRVEGDKAYGLGAADCKGGVAVSLYGLKIAKELGLIPRDLEITLIYNCDEETGSRESRGIIEAEASEAQLALVFEPSREDGVIAPHRRGVICGAFEAIGQCRQGFRLAQDKSDATLAIERIVTSMESHDDPGRGIYFHAFQSPGEGPGLERAETEFLVTFGSQEELRYIRQTIEKIAGSVWAPQCQIRSRHEASFKLESQERGVARAMGLIKEAAGLLGLALAEEMPQGASDANWCAFFGLPAIDSLGPNMSDIHTKQESVSLKSMRDRTELFAMTVALLGQGFYGADRPWEP